MPAFAAAPCSRRRLLALTATLTVGACAGVLPLPGQGKPPKLFTLSPKSTYGPDLPTVDWQLVIEVPVIAASLDTTRIAVKRDPLTLEYFKGARWSERAPLMVQTLLVESFENTGRIVAVARQSTDLRPDYVLKTDLREFQAEYDGEGPPLADVRLNAKLVRMPDRTIIAAHNSAWKERARADELVAIVYAFDEALGKCLKSIVEWTLRAPAQAPA